ncbi:hypothetical protein HYQ46_004053 [Verticillium longisporum]|nr:hypothetical protein HYQ46_004053 [Verticillium longisporum]
MALVEETSRRKIVDHRRILVHGDSEAPGQIVKRSEGSRIPAGVTRHDQGGLGPDENVAQARDVLHVEANFLHPEVLLWILRRLDAMD